MEAARLLGLTLASEITVEEAQGFTETPPSLPELIGASHINRKFCLASIYPFKNALSADSHVVKETRAKT